jgi:hypothetical protein
MGWPIKSAFAPYSLLTNLSHTQSVSSAETSRRLSDYVIRCCYLLIGVRCDRNGLPITPVRVVSSPFVKAHGFGAAAALAVQAADQVMDENELESYVAGFERVLEPLLLPLAQRALQIVALAALTLREPVRIEDNE